MHKHYRFQFSETTLVAFPLELLISGDIAGRSVGTEDFVCCEAI
jgi:hypothetical protein